jgi:hypothetical protein
VHEPIDDPAAALRLEKEKLAARRYLNVPDDVSAPEVDLAIEVAVQDGYRTAVGISERVERVLGLRKSMD